MNDNNASGEGTCVPRQPSALAGAPGSTFRWCGDDYQKLADLGEGWALIAHPNGPAISNGDTISVIDIYEGESLAPRSIKLRAQEAFRRWAWRRLKPGLKFPDYGRSNAGGVPRPESAPMPKPQTPESL